MLDTLEDFVEDHVEFDKKLGTHRHNSQKVWFLLKATQAMELLCTQLEMIYTQYKVIIHFTFFVLPIIIRLIKFDVLRV